MQPNLQITGQQVEESEGRTDFDSEEIRDRGDEIAWQDWDSGGPGAGAGRISVIRFSGCFYIDSDEGLSEPIQNKEQAIERSGVRQVNSSTVAIWVEEAGVIFQRS